MPKHLTLTQHLPPDDLERRYRQAKDPVERSQWQILWLLSQGNSTKQVGQATSYSLNWIRTIAQHYNAAGAAGVGDQRHHNPGAAPLLSAAQQEGLRAALQQAATGESLWSGLQVAVWMAEHLGHPVHPQRGWEWLRRLGFTSKSPRPHHAKADPVAQAAFKKNFLAPFRRCSKPIPRSRSNCGARMSTALDSSPFCAGSGA